MPIAKKSIAAAFFVFLLLTTAPIVQGACSDHKNNFDECNKQGGGCWSPGGGLLLVDPPSCYDCKDDYYGISSCQDYGTKAPQYRELASRIDACKSDGCGIGCDETTCNAIKLGEEQKGDLKKYGCDCTCQKVKTCSAGRSTKSEEEAAHNCFKQCARNCGGYAPYDADCDKNCQDYCTNGYSGTQEGIGECVKSCENVCESNKMTGDLTNVIYMVAGILGAVMLIIHAIRFAVASEPDERDEAKKGMLYVFAALVIIFLAISAVDFFTGIGGATKPGPCTALAAAVPRARRHAMDGV